MSKRLAYLALASIAALSLGALAPAGATGTTGTTAPTLRDWQAVADGGTIEVPLHGATARVHLRENPLLTPGARASLAEHGVDASGITTLQGEVEGAQGSLVRMTVSPTAAMGFIRTAAGTVEVNATERTADVRTPAVTGLMIDTEPSELHFDCTAFVPGHVASPTGITGGWGPRITFNLAVAADQTYVTQWSRGDGSWVNDAIATVNSADAIYDQLNMDISLVDLHNDTYVNTDSSQLLDDIKFHYRAYHDGMQRDAVALLVYKEIGPLGQASCISGAGLDDRANLVMTTNAAPFNLLGVELYSNIYGKTLAHEMGHLLSAHHHYANCVQASRAPASDVCTLMTPYVDGLDEVIGSLEALVIRGWAENHMA